MTHVLEDLELYAIGALPELDAAHVAAHLAECPGCRAEARALAAVIDAIPGTLPEREPTPGLGARILTTARADGAATTAPRGIVRGLRTRAGLTFAALSAAVLALAALDLGAVQELQAASAERDAFGETVRQVSQGGRWWYMAGKDDLSDSGGTLIASRATGRAFVLFHDLRPLDGATRYTIWLVNTDGRQWSRVASFRPDGRRFQAVDVGVPLAGYDRCAVTLEPSDSGPRLGRIVMESRIFPQ